MRRRVSVLSLRRWCATDENCAIVKRRDARRYQPDLCIAT